MRDVINELPKGGNRIPVFIDKLKENDQQVVLYGAGYCGFETLQLLRKHQIKIQAVCDDGRVGQYLEDIKITDIAELEPQENTVILITSGFNKAMKSKLEKLGLLGYYAEIDFGRYDAEKENLGFFEEHKGEINKAFNLLSDEKSKGIFLKLCQYRVSRDSRFLPEQDAGDQYYPKEEGLDFRGKKYDFLDLGAYDGDSIHGFVNYTIDTGYNSIYAFEASKGNYDKLVDNTRDLHDMKAFNLGVHSEKTRISFVISDAKNSFADDSGTSFIDVDSIDDVIGQSHISFIKSDVEGAEYEAIRGGYHVIQRDRPLMAISIYHLVEDLYRLQLLIEEFCPGKYDYYIRHYSPTVIETVLYAVPKDF